MNTPTHQRIVEYVASHGRARPSELVKGLNVSQVMIQRSLKILLARGDIAKQGSAPLVFYTLTNAPRAVDTQVFGTAEQMRLIEETYVHVTSDGALLSGVAGFTRWQKDSAPKRQLADLANEYEIQLNAIDQRRNELGLIPAIEKLQTTFGSTPINSLYYSDVYSIPTFGRTSLARLVMHAKNHPEKSLMDMILQRIQRPLNELIAIKHIDAVCFIPPTVPRPVQFMHELTEGLHIPLPLIDLVKVKSGDIAVPQKSLSSTAERVTNARQSMFIRSNTQLPYKNILIIDDVAGSGASFHEVAKKIMSICAPDTRLIAFAIVGNIKGYEVMRQI